MASKKRLIDVNALIAKYDRIHVGEPGKARKLMEDAPTVDAVEVVYAKAVPVRADIDYDDTLIRMDRQCSRCGALITQWDHFCPSCGANMMDGERKDNERKAD